MSAGLTFTSQFHQFLSLSLWFSPPAVNFLWQFFCLCFAVQRACIGVFDSPRPFCWISGRLLCQVQGSKDREMNSCLEELGASLLRVQASKFNGRTCSCILQVLQDAAKRLNDSMCHMPSRRIANAVGFELRSRANTLFPPQRSYSFVFPLIV